MGKRNWKGVQPRSLEYAMELCKWYAKDVHNLSVERIAERMGVARVSTLYKWLEEASMPAVRIPNYEYVCGCHFITQYLGASSRHLLVPMPKAKPAKDTDLMALQGSFGQAVAILAQYYQGQAEAEAAKAELARLMGDVASHHARVERMAEPELELFGDDQ